MFVPIMGSVQGGEGKADEEGVVGVVEVRQRRACGEERQRVNEQEQEHGGGKDGDARGAGSAAVVVGGGFPARAVSRLVAVLALIRVILDQALGQQEVAKKYEEEQMELARSKQLSESLLEVVRVVVEGEKLMDILENIINHVIKTLRVDRASIFIVDEKTNELWCKVAAEHSGFRVPLVKESIAGWVAVTRNMLNIEDACKKGSDLYCAR